MAELVSYAMTREDYEWHLRKANCFGDGPLPDGLRIERCPCKTHGCRGWVALRADGRVWPWGMTLEEWASAEWWARA